MDIRYQVKQFVAKVETTRSAFFVFMTGDPKYYWFQQLNPQTGCVTNLGFPVKKSDLRKDVASGLKHGWGVKINERI